MSEPFKVLLDRKAQRHYDKQTVAARRRISQAIDALCESPFRSPSIKRISGQLDGYCSLRIGNLRAIYEILTEKRPVIVKDIGPRGGIY